MLSIKEEHGWLREGSGVPAGTEYHWYILAHQNVKKIDANNYTTSMIGLKYKLAHKRNEKENGIPQIFHKKSDSYKYWKS